MNPQLDIRQILQLALDKQAADIILIGNQPVSLRVNGEILPMDDRRLTLEDTHALIDQIFSFTDRRERDQFYTTGDCDFSLSLPGVGRFRVNAYRQRNSPAAVIRTVRFDLPDPAALNIPPQVMRLAEIQWALCWSRGPRVPENRPPSPA